LSTKKSLYAPKNRQKTCPMKNRSQNRRRDPQRAAGRAQCCTHARPTAAHRHVAAPKPPQNGYFIWGRHAVFAALDNPERRIAQIYAASDDGESEINACLARLPADRRGALPAIQRIDRQRLDAIGGAHDKAVHQAVAAAVWPLDPPHLDDFLATHRGTQNLRLLLLDQLSDPRNVGAIMRSARAFGVAAVITTFRNAAEESGTLARAASGALDHLPYLRVTNLARAIETKKPLIYIQFCN
jgi:23S rRNA (guanosine2251-2'-O)-methyltransferase